MNQGWISLHRKLLDNPICRRPNYAWLWVVLLLKANHEEHSFIWNGKKEICFRGQILTGRNSLSKETGISSSTIERALKYFESEGQIEQQKNNKFRLITVKKYNQYQESEQQKNNKRTTKEHLADTNNNENNDNNENNSYISDSVESGTEKEINKVLEVFYQLNKAINFANKSYRNSAKILIKKYGPEKTVNAAIYALSIQAQKYAPQITNPTQLMNKFGDLIIFKQKESAQKPFYQTPEEVYGNSNI